jgi:DNA repair protein RadC
MKQINELYKDDKPREKIVKSGASALKNRELIALILGSGQKNFPLMTISKSIESLLEKEGVDGVDIEKLKNIKGVGTAKAAQIAASFELAKRFLVEPDKFKITGPRDIFTLLQQYCKKQQEHFIAVNVDGANNVINSRVVFIGTLNQSIVHPREVFAPAFTDRAAAVIIAHNHPSGNIEPSFEDIAMTKKLTEAGSILGIEILDHVIIADKNYYSFKTNGKL